MCFFYLERVFKLKIIVFHSGEEELTSVSPWVILLTLLRRTSVWVSILPVISSVDVFLKKPLYLSCIYSDVTTYLPLTLSWVFFCYTIKWFQITKPIPMLHKDSLSWYKNVMVFYRIFKKFNNIEELSRMFKVLPECHIGFRSRLLVGLSEVFSYFACFVVFFLFEVFWTIVLLHNSTVFEFNSVV